MAAGHSTAARVRIRLARDETSSLPSTRCGRRDGGLGWRNRTRRQRRPSTPKEENMRLRVQLATFLAALVAASATPAQQAATPLPAAKPEQVGMSTQRLGRLSDAFKQEVDQGKLPGAVIMIARKGRLVYAEAFGMQDKGKGTPMSRDTIFRIYSMTKPLASTALMMLVEEGRVQLTDPVSKFLPAFKAPAGQRRPGRLDLCPRELHARAGGARDDDPGPVAPYLGARIRRDHAEPAREERLQQVRRLQERDRLRGARPDAAGTGRAARQGAARAPARDGVGVQPRGRRAGPRRGSGDRNSGWPISWTSASSSR